MLTKDDLKQIEEIVQKSIEIKVKPIIKSAFQDFYDNIFEPHATQSVRHHEEIVKEIKGLKKEVTKSKEETGKVTEFIKDNEKRITHLEVLTSTKN